MDFVKKIFLGVISLVLIVSLIFSLKLVVFDGVARDKALYTRSSNDVNLDNKATNNTTIDNVTTVALDENYKEIAVSEIEDTKYLNLVNSKYSVEEVDESKLKTTKNGLHQIRSDVYDYVVDFMNHGAQKGYDSFVNSGFRTIKTQEEAYSTASAAELPYLAKPGYSEHHTGLAFDIVPMAETIGDDQLKKETSDYLHEIAHNYGLILRYPEDKEKITKIKYEYWHFRFVGKASAKYIYDNNLVLEEYIDLLKNKKSLMVNVDDNQYKIYYVIANNDKVVVPTKNEYEISSDNTGGYIVTEKIK